MVIISGSGMASGGRVVHHLKHRLGDPSTIVLFTGFQAMGTLGRKIVDGNEIVEIHGMEVPVRAKIEKIGSLSAPAGQDECRTATKILISLGLESRNAES